MYDFHYHLQTSKIIELTEFRVKTGATYILKESAHMMCASCFLKTAPKRPEIEFRDLAQLMQFSKMGTLRPNFGRHVHL
jgi:hypothetical protein